MYEKYIKIASEDPVEVLKRMKNRIAIQSAPTRPAYISMSAECWIAMAPEGSAISKMSAAEFRAWAEEHPNCMVEEDVDKTKPMNVLRIRNPNPRVAVVDRFGEVE